MVEAATVRDILFVVLSVWTLALVVWTDMLDRRARNIRRVMQRRAERRHPNGRTPRVDSHTLHAEIEQYLKDVSR